MSVFLKREKSELHDKLNKHKVIQHLHDIKKIRVKRRLKTLLLSKRGLSTAFIAGMITDVLKDDKNCSSSGLAKKTQRIASVGLSSWLSGA